MSDADPAKPLSELLEPGSTLMVGTGPSESLDFRPLTVSRIDGDQIQILLDTTADWTKTLRQGDRVWITASDTRKNTWMSLVGTASTTTDEKLIDELWNPFAEAYFDNGRESVGIAVMLVDGESGSYWTTPSGRLGSLISMVKAKLGRGEDAGEHGEVAV